MGGGLTFKSKVWIGSMNIKGRECEWVDMHQGEVREGGSSGVTH